MIQDSYLKSIILVYQYLSLLRLRSRVRTSFPAPVSFAELGDPSTDKDRLTAISSLFHAEKIIKPLLVVLGANDPRVLQVESDELVEKVMANDVPVEYVLFDDEGHKFRKRINRVTASEAYLSFLEKYL